MAGDASDLIKAAETLYGEPLTPGATNEIRKLLETGIARASGLLANIIMCDYLNRWNDADRQNLDDATEAVSLALKYADNVAVAHYAQAFIHRANNRHQEAYDSFVLSLQYNPGSVRTRAQMAAELLYLGRFADALREIDRAIADGAGSPALGMFQWIKGRTLFFMDRHEEAIPCLKESIESWEDLWYNRLYLISALALRERTAEANAMLAEFKERFPGFNTIEDVKTAESTNPNTNPAVVKGRETFHAGLEKAGIPPK